MWNVEPPQVAVVEAAQACAQGVRDKDLADRIRNSRKEMEANGDALRLAIETDRQHFISATTYELTRLTDLELTKLYTQQMAKARRPGRKIYGAVMAGALHGLCSYCQYGVACTLDHFVPKSAVPALSIDPWNLVPCCRDCNSRLRDQFGTKPTNQLFHPYRVPKLGRWLQAQIDHVQPVTASFRAEPAATLSKEIRSRLENQFDALNLANLYAVVSAQEITVTTRSLRKYFLDAPVHQIRNHLLERSEMEFTYSVNSRQAVLFEALANDDWYCTTGFLGELAS